MAAGASEEEAQRRAIERFGHPRTVARRFSARLAPVPPAAVAAELARAAVLLGAVGLVAIGASGPWPSCSAACSAPRSWPATCPA